MKKLIISICTLAIAAALLGASTFAWFSMNRKVDVTGMKVSAKADSSLVITKSATGLPTAETISASIDFADSTATNLYASTHDLSISSGTTLTYSTGLKKVTAASAQDVDPSTGLAKSGKTLSYETAENASSKNYYKDYVVYICSQNDDLGNQVITVKWSNDALTDINAAISIDFYYASVTSAETPSVSSTTYQGTLNLAYITGNNYTPQTDYSITIGSTGITIPEADGTGAIAVLMRVYSDGALLNSATTTYLKNIDVTDISAQTLGVEFTASTKSSS